MGRPVSRAAFVVLGTILTMALALMSTPVTGHGAAVSRLRAGAVEVGLAGSLTSVEGSTRASLVARAGTFMGALSGLAGCELELGYYHDRVLDGLNVEGAFSWQYPVGGGAVFPFASIGGGVREETLGSFSQARYPLGFALGLRALSGTRAAVRVEYRYRRVLNDPVADYTEHQALTGISLVLRNSERPARGEETVP